MTKLDLTDGATLTVELGAEVKETVYRSLYDDAVKRGFSGSFDDFLIAIKGDVGAVGKSAYEVAVENGFSGSKQEWLESLKSTAIGLVVDETRLMIEQEVHSKFIEQGYEMIAENRLLPLGGDGYLPVHILKKGARILIELNVSLKAVLTKQSGDFTDAAAVFRIDSFSGYSLQTTLATHPDLHFIDDETLFLLRGVKVMISGEQLSIQNVNLNLASSNESLLRGIDNLSVAFNQSEMGQNTFTFADEYVFAYTEKHGFYNDVL